MYCTKCITKIQLMNHLASDKKLLNEVKAKIHKHWSEDIFQDILMYIHEKYDEEFLLKLNTKNQIKYFIFGILWRQTHSTKNKTYKNYGLGYSGLEIKFDLPIETDNSNYELFDPSQSKELIDNALKDNVNWYDKEIFLTYLNSNKSFRELELELNISRTSLTNTVNKVKQKIKDYVIKNSNI